MKIKSYFNDDEDINLLNAQYVKPFKDESTGKWSDGHLYLTYRDNKTKEKLMKHIINPEVETFITNINHRSDFNTQRLFLSKDCLDSHIVPYNKITGYIINEIKKDGNDTDFLKIVRDSPKEAFKWRHSYFADYDLCDYAFMAYTISNLDPGIVTNTKVTTAFLDIESDVYGLTTSEMNEGIAPMNAVSVVIPYDEKGKKYKHPKVFTLLLRDHFKYKQQEYFENNMDKFLEECHQEFDKKYDEPEFIIKLYDDEIILFRNLFALLHKLRPDFICIWNMSYDVPTMIQRLKYLGQNPVNYFCHPDFVQPYYRYNYDLIYKNDFKNKTESFECTSYSAWIDQMLNYAGIRKSRREYGGNSLDNVSKIELKAQKRRFDSITTNVTNAAREEYWNFVKYSINDVLLQYGIDRKTEDTQTLFEQAIYGGTRIYKALKQSVYLKNVFTIDYLERDIVPRNNKNVNYSKYKNEDDAIDDDESVENNDPDSIALQGALVGDPSLNTNNGVILRKRIKSINNMTDLDKSNHLFEYVIDFDFASMYPNIKICSNIAENTQLGRIVIDMPVLENENPLKEEKYMRASKFIEDFESDDSTLLGKWLHLPNASDIIEKYNDKYHPAINIKMIMPDLKYDGYDEYERDDHGRIILHRIKKKEIV